MATWRCSVVATQTVRSGTNACKIDPTTKSNRSIYFVPSFHFLRHSISRYSLHQLLWKFLVISNSFLWSYEVCGDKTKIRYKVEWESKIHMLAKVYQSRLRIRKRWKSSLESSPCSMLVSRDDQYHWTQPSDRATLRILRNQFLEISKSFKVLR